MYSIPLIITSKSEPPVKYHLIPIRMAIIKNTKENKMRLYGKKQTLSPVGNINWSNHHREQCGGSLKN